MSRRYYSSIAERATLSFSVDATTTTFFVNAVVGWPSNTPYTLLVDADTINEEIVTVTNRSGTTLTVIRGVDGSTARAHDAGADVRHGVSGRDFDEPNAFINGTGVVTEALLASDAVTSAKILDGTIVNADINASAAIAQSKIADLTADLGSKLNIAGGKILQIVRATDSTNRSTTSTSITDASLSVTITPQQNTSAVILIASCRVRIEDANSGIAGVGILQITDNSDNAVSGAQGANFTAFAGAANEILLVTGTLIGYATPATFNATTYKLRFGVSNAVATLTLENASNTGQLYAIEVSA
jgi:hypothetical protein